MTLTGADLYQLELESVAYILVQGKTGETVIALDVTEVLQQAEEAGADLLIQLAETGTKGRNFLQSPFFHG